MTLKELLKNNPIIRDLHGTYRIIRSWIKYIGKQPYRDSIRKHESKKEEDFTSFFTEVEISRRNETQALGINLSSLEKADADGQRWLDFLVSEGLNKNSTALDYGCGSLRLGKSLINYLEVGKYVGVDISDHFYSLGIKNYLGESISREKQAKFHVIDSESYKQNMKNRRFDFIYSQWVMMHVHPGQLGHYFDNILSLMDANSRFIFDFTHSVITLKQNALTWGYPTRKVRGLIRERGFNMERIKGNMYRVSKQS